MITSDILQLAICLWVSGHKPQDKTAQEIRS